MAEDFAIDGDWGTARALPPTGRWVLHADPADADAMATAWGAPLPPMLRAAGHHPNGAGGDRAALMLGPDEWLLLADDPAAVAGFTPALPPHSLVDVSDRQLGIELTGHGVPTLLNAGTPLDLADAAFPPGSATRTLFGKVEILLWRIDADRWRLEFWRSYADYVTRLLARGAADV